MQTILSPIHSGLAADPELGALVEMFVAEIPQRLEAVQAFFSHADWEGLARAVHSKAPPEAMAFASSCPMLRG